MRRRTWIFEELKVFNLTNKEGLERAVGAGWHLKIFTDVILQYSG